jgi:hypothetical protein
MLLAEYPQISPPTSFCERTVTASNKPNTHHSDEHTASLRIHPGANARFAVASDSRTPDVASGVGSSPNTQPPDELYDRKAARTARQVDVAFQKCAIEVRSNHSMTKVVKCPRENAGST